jgi:hypothetical protein
LALFVRSVKDLDNIEKLTEGARPCFGHAPGEFLELLSTAV